MPWQKKGLDYRLISHIITIYGWFLNTYLQVQDVHLVFPTRWTWRYSQWRKQHRQQWEHAQIKIKHSVLCVAATDGRRGHDLLFHPCYLRTDLPLDKTCSGCLSANSQWKGLKLLHETLLTAADDWQPARRFTEGRMWRSSATVASYLSDLVLSIPPVSTTPLALSLFWQKSSLASIKTRSKCEKTAAFSLLRRNFSRSLLSRGFWCCEIPWFFKLPFTL